MLAKIQKSAIGNPTTTLSSLFLTKGDIKDFRNYFEHRYLEEAWATKKKFQKKKFEVIMSNNSYTYNFCTFSPLLALCEL